MGGDDEKKKSGDYLLIPGAGGGGGGGGSGDGGPGATSMGTEARHAQAHATLPGTFQRETPALYWIKMF